MTQPQAKQQQDITDFEAALDDYYAELDATQKEQEPRMSQWIYVEARMIDGYVSFAHVFIEALNEDDAYDQGITALDGATHMSYVGDFLNDYVIELENL